jgi:vitamin B12 transport system permease protein
MRPFSLRSGKPAVKSITSLYKTVSMPDFVHRQHRSDRRRLLVLVLLLIVAAGVSLCAGDRWMGRKAGWR